MEKIAVSINQNWGSPIGDVVLIGDLVSIIVSNAVFIAGALLVVLLVIGGVSFIMGAGGGDPQKAAQGKQAITYAVAGFLIIFTAYWIIQGLEILTGVDILNPTL